MLALLAGGAWYLNVRQQEKLAFDEATFCPKTGPQFVRAVLIDRTDAMTELQLATLKNHMISWAKQMPKRGALVVYEVGVGGAVAQPVFSICSPGDGSDASAFNSDPSKLRTQYRSRYLRPIEELVSSMGQDSLAQSSPIMQAIQAIAVNNFGEDHGSPEAELIVVSDLLQHSGDISLYRNVPEPSAFAKSPAGRSLRADLTDVNVTVYLVNRIKDAKFQTDQLGNFWVKWLTIEGAQVSGFKHLPG